MATYKEPDSQKIKDMFTEIAPSYDKANSVLSLGIHHLWKNSLVDWSGAKLGNFVLDTATGTGDLAIQFKRTVGPNGSVIGTDFCPEILSHAPAKAKKENLDIRFQEADVTNLPFKDNQFDVSSISFGIRNVDNLDAAIMELARVTKPKGKVMILEFGQVTIPILKDAYNFYSTKILPKIGGWVSGKQNAYAYLNDSSQAFPCRHQFVDRMMATGKYSKVEFKTLSLGIAYIYKATPVD